MNKKEYLKMLEKADKQGEKDIKESRKEIEKFIDESKKALIVINEKGVITICKSI